MMGRRFQYDGKNNAKCWKDGCNTMGRRLQLLGVKLQNAGKRWQCWNNYTTTNIVAASIYSKKVATIIFYFASAVSNTRVQTDRLCFF